MLEHLLGTPALESITLRAALAAITAFLAALAGGPLLIRALARRRVVDRIEKGDSAEVDALHVSKKDTPTMGGLLIVGAMAIAVLLFGRLDAFFVRLLLATVIGLALVGLWDDVLKLTTGGQGLRPRAKLALLVAIGLLCGTAVYAHYGEQTLTVEAAVVTDAGGPSSAHDVQARSSIATPPAVPSGTAVTVPLLRGVRIPLGLSFVLFAALVLVATTNAVNFTDGLDGLAAGTSAFVIATYTAIAYATGRTDFAGALGLDYVAGAGEASVCGAALFGSTLGFLWYNGHPAQIFMGDTGSLALGGGVACLALATRQELLLVLAGGVFVLEGLSVVTQVGWFKLTGRRIFRCAPIHHHFQLRGVFETQVTTRLWIVSAICGVAALAALKVR